MELAEAAPLGDDGGPVAVERRFGHDRLGEDAGDESDRVVDEQAPAERGRGSAANHGAADPVVVENLALVEVRPRRAGRHDAAEDVAVDVAVRERGRRRRVVARLHADGVLRHRAVLESGVRAIGGAHPRDAVAEEVAPGELTIIADENGADAVVFERATAHDWCAVRLRENTRVRVALHTALFEIQVRLRPQHDAVALARVQDGALNRAGGLARNQHVCQGGRENLALDDDRCPGATDEHADAMPVGVRHRVLGHEVRLRTRVRVHLGAGVRVVFRHIWELGRLHDIERRARRSGRRLVGVWRWVVQQHHVTRRDGGWH
mmetsp:Transcript_1248/g.4082  ORF Transcript_1248/g.4082 Transcript_1248/m.4082 type:complete len:320 (-) Transcript_1248:206-1165(-)